MYIKLFTGNTCFELDATGDCVQTACIFNIYYKFPNVQYQSDFCNYDFINSFSAGPYKRRTCRIYGTVYDFADSYLRFGACYVDENATIRFSETISPNSYR